MRIALIVVAVAGCDVIYGLPARPPIDAVEVADVPIDQPIDAAELTCPPNPARPDDEDNDDFPNSCDNCPHVMQFDQADQDNDGVGDACDPRQGPPDKFDYFDGFDSLPAGLELLPSGRWKVDNGRLVAFGVPQPSDAIARLRHDVGNAQIITRVTVMMSDGDPESVGLWARLGPTMPANPEYPAGVLLEILRNTGTVPVRGCHIVETYQLQTAAVNCAQNQQLFQTGKPYTMSLDCTEGPAPECHGVIAFDVPTHMEIPIEWPTATRVTGAAGLRVYSVDAAFDYVVVIRHE